VALVDRARPCAGVVCLIDHSSLLASTRSPRSLRRYQPTSHPGNP